LASSCGSRFLPSALRWRQLPAESSPTSSEMESEAVGSG
jgi:hypothetical protein